MYKTKVTTKEDIEKAIKPLEEAINDASFGSDSTVKIARLEMPDAEFIINTLETCVNKFPDKA